MAQKQDPEPKGVPDPATTKRRRKGGRAKRFGVWSLSALLTLSIAGVLLVVILVGQTLHVPDWVRGRIESRLEQKLNGLQISFGDVSVIVDKGWRPRVRLRDVVLTAPTGIILLELSEAEASLAMRPLLRGQIQPKQISLSGAFATLRRDKNGAFALSLGNNNATFGEAADLPHLIDRWEQAFQTPLLAALTTVELSALTIRYEDARQRRGWTLDDGRISLSRKEDQLSLTSSFAVLGGRDYASSVEISYTSRLGNSAADIRVAVQDVHTQDIAVQNVALGWLTVLRAPISGAFRASIDDKGQFGPVSATLQIGKGVVQPNESARPIPFNGARTYFTYDPAEQLLTFDEVSIDSDWVSGIAEGRAYLGGVETGKLREMVGQFTLTGMTLNPQQLYGEPLVLDRVAVDFRLNLNPFRLDIGEMRITDQDRIIRLNGTLGAGDDGWHVAVNGEADQLDTDRLIALWPVRAIPKPRIWVSQNLSGGTLSDIDFALRITPGKKPDIYLDFNYQDATVRFLKTLPPITGATGQASLIRGRFVTTATAGLVTPDEGGPLDITGTSFIIPDVTIKKAAPGIVRLVASGSVTAVISLLNRPPLSVLKHTPLPVSLAEGQARLTGTLSLQLKKQAKFEDFEFHATGEITNVRSSVLVPGQVVTTPLLLVRANQTEVIVSGHGKIGEIPVDVRWRQPLGNGRNHASQLTGQIELSQDLVDTFNLGLPNNSVSGRGTGDFVLDLVPGKPLRLSIKSDLAGVGLRLPELGWRKSKSSTGVFELGGTLGEQTNIDHLVLRAAGLSATGTVSNHSGGGLDRARFSAVKLKGWLDVQVELIGRGKRPPDIRILGGTLDMRRATFGTGGGGGSSSGASTGKMTVSLDRLQVTDSLSLTDFAGTFRLAGGMKGPFTGRINGQTSITGDVVPQGARSAVRIQSKDAGGVFRSAGLLDQGRGGNFEMTLQAHGDPGHYQGELRVTNTRVKNAPTMAALLNSISVVGLLDQMSGQGILFSEVEARFDLSPTRLTLYSSSAVGPSIGLSMDGSYDTNSGVLNMRGVVSPVYLLNGIGSVLTRKGEGLIGFNYRLRGPAASPKVDVNPLSVLTPGMFRDIFRKPATVAPNKSDKVFGPQNKTRRTNRTPPLSGGGDR